MYVVALVSKNLLLSTSICCCCCWLLLCWVRNRNIFRRKNTVVVVGSIIGSKDEHLHQCSLISLELLHGHFIEYVLIDDIGHTKVWIGNKSL